MNGTVSMAIQAGPEEDVFGELDLDWEGVGSPERPSTSKSQMEILKEKAELLEEEKETFQQESKKLKAELNTLRRMSSRTSATHVIRMGVSEQEHTKALDEIKRLKEVIADNSIQIAALRKQQKKAVQKQLRPKKRVRQDRAVVAWKNAESGRRYAEAENEELKKMQRQQQQGRDPETRPHARSHDNIVNRPGPRAERERFELENGRLLKFDSSSPVVWD
ncbi:hypothetical protein QR680_003910 [Steinernema hermaphroditum]|uniref:Uncharacterized protein n=1 Tax=Steinernema hermaphroditum TaxID=289476 RepID=A0AA39HM20_9BILA|nr:hypothetical protein QR680_003910 [Steinernema hermaphroditum]